MALTTTLAALRNEVRERGGLRRSTSLTDSILTNFINKGVEAVHSLMVSKCPDRIVKRTSPDLSTAIGVETVALPSDFLTLRSHPLRISGTTKLKILPFDIDEESWVDDDSTLGWGGAGYRYMLQAGNLRLLPTPTSVDTIRLWYLPHHTKLVADADVYDATHGADDLVIEHALKQATERDRRPAQTHIAEIQRMEQAFIRKVQVRDQSEPEYMVDYGRGHSIWREGF